VTLLNEHRDQSELCADFLGIGVADAEMLGGLADAEALVIDSKLDESLSLTLIS